jgi:hypothetical protein
MGDPKGLRPPFGRPLPLARLNDVPFATVTLLTESDPFEVWVTVTPLMPSSASSDDVGTWWSLELAALTQLLAVSQSPPAGLIQFIVASKVWSSITSHRGRKAQVPWRSARRRILLDVRAWGTNALPPILAWHDIGGLSLRSADDAGQKITRMSAQIERREMPRK